MPAGSNAPEPGGARGGAFTLPNAITLARLCAVPATVWLILHERLDEAFYLFAAAGLSDALDGWLARRLNAHSPLGAMLDPLADKALLVSIYVALAIHGVLPGWVAIVVVFRDIMIVAALLLSMLLDKPMEVRPLIISKLNTGAQIGFAALMLGSNAFGGAPPLLVEVGLMLTVALTLCSAGAYLVLWLRHMAA